MGVYKYFALRNCSECKYYIFLMTRFVKGRVLETLMDKKKIYEICKVIHVKWQQQKELLIHYFSLGACTQLRQKHKVEVFSFEFIKCFAGLN